MNIKTKFNLGDKVYPIELTGRSAEDTCTCCLGLGTLTQKITNKNIKCFECKGMGIVTVYPPSIWVLDDKGIISAVKYNLYEEERSYMKGEADLMYEFYSLAEYPERDLFITKEEAEAECANRNKVINE